MVFIFFFLVVFPAGAVVPSVFCRAIKKYVTCAVILFVILTTNSEILVICWGRILVGVVKMLDSMVKVM